MENDVAKLVTIVTRGGYGRWIKCLRAIVILCKLLQKEAESKI